MKNINLIYKLIDEAKVVSFDIFDTLLYRPYMKPSDLFLHLEKISGKTGFYNSRINAENMFYKSNGNSREANLDDIYNTIPEFYDLKEKELELELCCLKLNFEIKEIYNYVLKTKKTIIITSDMYLPVSFIKIVLEKNNIQYDKLYLSNAIGKRKDNGKLYDYIIKDLNILPSDILHIGDNKFSDYIQAKNHGIKAFLYLPQIKIFNDKIFLKLYKNNKENITSSIITKLVIDNSYQYSDYWTNFGYKYAGPLVFQYTSWIYSNAISNNLNNILFVARDGHIIKKIFDLINTTNIKSNYIYAPRILNYILNLDFNKNAKEHTDIVCKYFNIDSNGKSSKNYINDNPDKIKNMSLLVKDKISYDKYIKSVINDNKRIGIVDTISEQLSAQKLVEKEANIKAIGFYITTLNDNYKQKEQYYSFVEKGLRKAILEDSITDLIELIFSSPENPIIDFENGQKIYQKNIREEEKYRQEVFCKIEEGIIAFCKDLLHLFKYEQICFDNFTCVKNFLYYIKNISKKEFKIITKVCKSPFADNSLYIPIFYNYVTFKGKILIVSQLQYSFISFITQFINIRFTDNKINLYILSFLRKNICSFVIFNKINIVIGKII